MTSNESSISETLTIHRFRAECGISRDRLVAPALNSAEINLVEDSIGGLLAKVEVAIYASQPTSITLKAVPASWWQLVKMRLAPKWVLKHFPVRMIDFVLPVRLLYPEKIVNPSPSLGRPVPFVDHGANDSLDEVVDISLSGDAKGAPLVPVWVHLPVANRIASAAKKDMMTEDQILDYLLDKEGA